MVRRPVPRIPPRFIWGYELATCFTGLRTIFFLINTLQKFRYFQTASKDQEVVFQVEK